jgi:hypothetical protein
MSCGKWNNDDQYEVNKEQYPKCFNESKGYNDGWNPLGLGRGSLLRRL